MSKMIITVFENEEAARNGLGVLQSVHGEGPLSLFASAILVKDQDETVEVKEVADRGPEGTAAGMLFGGLLGLMAGPLGAAAGATAGVAAYAALGGAALGASMGGLAGMAADLDEVDVDVHFVTEAAKAIAPGEAALLAEVVEDDDAQLEERLEAAGGDVHRYRRVAIADELYEIRVREYEAEWEELREEWRQSTGETRARIEEKLAATRGKIETLNQNASERLRINQKRADVQIAVLRDEAKTANDERKQRLEARIEAIREDLATRNAKLKQARQLTGEALAAKPADSA